MEADLLQKQTETGKLVVKDGWVICPRCNSMKPPGCRRTER